MRPVVLVLALLTVLPALAPLAPPAAASMVAALPTARSLTSAVWTGTAAYVFGGLGPSGALDEVVRYDPASGNVSVVAYLPTPRYATSAVWDGTYAYLFGGRTATSARTDDILRFDPATNDVTELAATLPDARANTSAVWTGDRALVFAGNTGGGDLPRQVIVFDAANGTTTYGPGLLPTNTYVWMGWDGTTAFWDGGKAYVVLPWDCSGWCGTGRYASYDPFTGASAFTDDEPDRGAYTGSAWDGERAYVVGGYHRGGHSSIVWAYHAQNETLHYTTFAIDSFRQRVSAVWDGGRVLAFGGHVDSLYSPDVYSDAIESFTPGPSGPVSGLRALAGVDQGEVLLRWGRPTDTGGFLAERTLVYRGTTLIADIDGEASGLVDAPGGYGAVTYTVVPVTHLGTGATANTTGTPATASLVGAHVTIVLRPQPLPTSIAFPSGGSVTFQNLATSSLDVRTTGGWCINTNLAPNAQATYHLAFDPNDDAVALSEDGVVYRDCDDATHTNGALGADVQYEVGTWPRSYGTFTVQPR